MNDDRDLAEAKTPPRTIPPLRRQMKERTVRGEAIVVDKNTTLTVGLTPVRGVGLRVGMKLGHKLATLSPAKARRLAKDYEKPRRSKWGWAG